MSQTIDTLKVWAGIYKEKRNIDHLIEPFGEISSMSLEIGLLLLCFWIWKRYFQNVRGRGYATDLSWYETYIEQWDELWKEANPYNP